MSGKKLVWDEIANVAFDDKRRKAHGTMTGKELFAKAHETLRKAEEHKSRRAEIEPILRQNLLKHMVSRLPITVMVPIQNPTESIGGVSKSEDDDGFYGNRRTGPSKEVSFEEVMETIPVGVELIFKAWDKQLSQWIFKGSNGQEYAIYDKNVIMFKGGAIENPGLYGLLFNSSIADVLNE